MAITVLEMFVAKLIFLAFSQELNILEIQVLG
jgi:hypothetical protein